MELVAARRLAKLLTQYGKESQNVHRTIAREAGELQGFHKWTNGKQALGAWLVSTQADAAPIWLALVEWNPNKQPGNYYVVLFPQSRSGPIAEVHRSGKSEDGEFLTWRYIPKRGDGRNKERKSAFERAYGTIEPQVHLPESVENIDEFIEQLMRLAECREAANALLDLPATVSPALSKGGFSGLSKSEKCRVVREIEVRLQQRALRSSALAAFGASCAVSGPHCPEVLEAAHIREYDDFRDNTLGNCLLLRRDLHALYDARLLGLHPTNATVHFATAALRAYYATEADRLTHWTTGARQPYARSIRHRWKEFVAEHRDTMVPTVKS